MKKFSIVLVVGVAACTSSEEIAFTTQSAEYFVPFASDCTEISKQELEDFVATVADGDTIKFEPGGCYAFNDSLVFHDFENLVIEGNHATLKATRDPEICGAGNVAPARARLQFELGGNIVVRDLTLEGSNTLPSAACPRSCLPGESPATHECWPEELRARMPCYWDDYEGDANLRVMGTQGITVTNVDLRNTWGDAVEVGPYFGTDEMGETFLVVPSAVAVSNATVSVASRHAFGVTGCAGCTFDTVAVDGVAYWVVDVETEIGRASFPADYEDYGRTIPAAVTVTNVDYDNVYLGLLNAGTGEETGRRGPFMIVGNTRLDTPTTLWPELVIGNFDLVNGPQYEIDDVEIRGNNFQAAGASMLLTNVTNVDVRENHVVQLGAGEDRPAIRAVGVEGIIRDNTFLSTDPMYTAVDSPALVVCSNATTETGTFDQPVVCP